MKPKQLILAFSFILLFNFVNGQDLRSGEITTQNIGPLRYSTSIILYTQISTSVSRPFIVWHSGNGTVDTLITPTPMIVFPDVFQFVYHSDHTYPGPGTYNMFIDIPYYVPGITNIANSGSENLMLSKNIIINPFSGAEDNSPVFMNPQEFEWTCCNWIYNPNAYDPDGDSLSYSLVPCNVQNYVFPNASIDSLSGDLIFTPDTIGRYAIAIQVDEWRAGSNIGSTTRQMLLNVNSLIGISEIPVIQFNFFPDPVINTLNISFPHPIENSRLEIYNALGEKLSDQNLAAGIIQFSMDVSQLANGMYFCRLISIDGIAAKKFQKL